MYACFLNVMNVLDHYTITNEMLTYIRTDGQTLLCRCVDAPKMHEETQNFTWSHLVHLGATSRE